MDNKNDIDNKDDIRVFASRYLEGLFPTYQAFTRRVISNLAVNRRLLASMLLFIAPMITLPALAQVCYSDAREAYASLIASEKRQADIEEARDERTWVNINTASEAELITLKGIGVTKAQEIILYREVFGEFASVDDLTQVHGIGPKTVENNRHRLRID